MDISKRIKKRRLELGLNLEDVASILGVSISTVSRYETKDIENMGIDKVDSLATALQCTPAYLMGWGTNTAESQDDITPGIIRIPVLGVIPAGIPIEAIEDIIDYEEVPADWGKGGKEFFGLKLKGDSMSPKYLDGDVVLFEKAETCESGTDAAVMVNGYDATFKKVVENENGVILQPINPTYEVKFYSNEEIESLPVRVMGVAVELRRSI